MTRTLQASVMCVCWWVLLVAPSVLSLAGVFSEGPDPDVPYVSTGLIVFWIVAYLAQLLVIMLVTRPARTVHAWWLLVASMLPWVVDWGSVYGTWIAVLLILLAAGVAGLIGLGAVRTIRLDEDGRFVTATVVRELPTRIQTVVNNIYVRRKVELDIPTADGTGTYRGEMAILYELGSRPEEGDQVSLRVDPGDPQRFALASKSGAGA
jgi:hypothetical protein